MSPDGTWCFAVENEVLSVFACRTGEVRGTRKVAAVRRVLWVGDEGGENPSKIPAAAKITGPSFVFHPPPQVSAASNVPNAAISTKPTSITTRMGSFSR